MHPITMNKPHDTLELSPGPTAIQQALQWLEELGERDGWPARTRFGLTLSVDEALTNVVSYAFAGRASSAPRPYIRLLHRAEPGTVHISITDNGVAFDPTGVPPPVADVSIETATIGGHGVQLMRHYLQAMAYTREDDENRLALTAQLPPPDTAA